MSDRSKMRVVVVGQTPPPYHGQAIAIESFLRGTYEHLDLFHVRMAFSHEMGDVGRLRLGKILRLPVLIARILWARVRTRAEVLYYPPSGSDRVPLVRDIAVLVCCRWAFRRTVFHFEAGGTSEAYNGLGPLLRWAYRRAYFAPDVAIELSRSGPADGEFLRAKRTVFVPNGAPDEAISYLPRRPTPARPVMLFVGVIRESKGVLVLIEACALLRDRGVDVEVRLMGEGRPPEFEELARRRVEELYLADRVTFLGRLVGEDKWRAYADADIFCFPTFFEHETTPLVLLEAMQFELPVVSTQWRGVGTMVADGETGFLVPVQDPAAVADRLAALAQDLSYAREIGLAGRRRYLASFTEDAFQRGVADAIAQVSDS